YSHLSFSSNAAFAEVCANHYHRLRAYMLAHAEAGSILRAID
ncbi:antirestriction protein, partial [Candidatus Roizmanbacteria bacterium]|nr:antirestriction protein [Candidatus Roizmanbacteria bacterium]